LLKIIESEASNKIRKITNLNTATQNIQDLPKKVNTVITTLRNKGEIPQNDLQELAGLFDVFE
jgi:hypothetical protein